MLNNVSLKILYNLQSVLQNIYYSIYLIYIYIFLVFTLIRFYFCRPSQSYFTFDVPSYYVFMLIRYFLNILRVCRRLRSVVKKKKVINVEEMDR